MFKKLLNTHRGKPDKDWWSLMVFRKSFWSGKRNPYGGWITDFLLGNQNLHCGDNFHSGLVTVPLTIEDPSGVKETGTLAAGILGFTIHEDGMSETPFVQPFQWWCLILPEVSPFHEISHWL